MSDVDGSMVVPTGPDGGSPPPLSGWSAGSSAVDAWNPEVRFRRLVLRRLAQLESDVCRLAALAGVSGSVVVDSEVVGMVFQIVDSDSSKHASVKLKDALGVDLPDASGVSVSFASSDPSKASVDASSGAITPASPVSLGAFQVSASGSDASGAAVSFAPADCEIVAGPAASGVVEVA